MKTFKQFMNHFFSYEKTPDWHFQIIESLEEGTLLYMPHQPGISTLIKNYNHYQRWMFKEGLSDKFKQIAPPFDLPVGYDKTCDIVTMNDTILVFQDDKCPMILNQNTRDFIKMKFNQ